MFRILPIAICIMFGALIYKATRSEEIISEASVVPHGEIKLEDFETASGTEEEMKEGSGHARDGAAEKEGLDALKANDNGLPDYVSITRPDENLLLISDAEKELLEKLKDRRNELNDWEKELDLKAGMIEASSKKLDKKIVELEKLRVQTQELITTYQGEEDAKIASLVKIYEAMKPKDAAKVFNEMNIDIMLLIIDDMKEKKAAPVLAKMNTKRAKQVTERLANQRSLAKERGIASR